MHVSCPSVPLLLRCHYLRWFFSLRLQVTVKGAPELLSWAQAQIQDTLYSSQGTLNFFAVLPPCTCLSLPLHTKPHLDSKAKAKLHLITNTLFTHKGKGEDRVEFGSENTQIRDEAKQHTGRRKERLLGDWKVRRVRPRSGPARKSCRDGVASLTVSTRHGGAWRNRATAAEFLALWGLVWARE